MNLEYIIDDGEVQPAINSEAVDIQLNFDSSDPSRVANVSLRNFDFSQDAAKIINEYFENGIGGGPGVTEGLPFKLNLRKGVQSLELINGYIDLSSSEVLIDCDRIEAFVQDVDANESVESQAEGFEFDLLEMETQTITSADYIYQPYVISSVPNNKEIAILLVMSFSVGLALRDAIQNVTQTAVELLGGLSAVRAVIKFVLIVAYLVVLIITIVNLFRDIVNQIIQPIKYHACMRLQTLLEKGAEHLGYTFESSLFLDPVWRDMVVMPPKYSSPPNDKDKNILGFTKPNRIIQKGYYEGTYAQLMTEFEILINGKKIITDNVIRIERRDFKTSTDSFAIPDAKIKGFGHNFSQHSANTHLSLTQDLTEANTIDDYEGNKCSVYLSRAYITNKTMGTLKGKRTITSGFAKGVEKTDFTGPEEFIRAIVQPIDKLTATLSSTAAKVGINVNQTNLTNLIDKRLRMLMIEKDSFDVHKLMTLDISPNAEGTKIKTVNRERVNMGDIYDKFYLIDSFVTTATDNPNANQYKFFKVPPTILCFDDLVKLKSSNEVIDQNDKEGELVSLLFNIDSETATEMIYKINEAYTDNLKQRKIVSNGVS